MSEILIFLAFSVYFRDGSISDIQTCEKVYTFCKYGAFFTKCTIINVEIVHLYICPTNWASIPKDRRLALFKHIF